MVDALHSGSEWRLNHMEAKVSWRVSASEEKKHFRSHLVLFMCPLGWPSQALMVEQQWSALINYSTNEVKKSQYTHDSLTHTHFSAEKYKYVGYSCMSNASNCSDLPRHQDLNINSSHSPKKKKKNIIWVNLQCQQLSHLYLFLFFLRHFRWKIRQSWYL